MEDELHSIPLSALQHWVYCPRQCGLIHLERVWDENRLTAEGRILHERVDSGERSARKGVRLLRHVELSSRRLGLHGYADVVELRGKPPRPVPVEYKRGRPKEHRADEVQLCAQGLCLEEMTGAPVPFGYLFYGRTRRRLRVAFDAPLRRMVEETAQAVRAMLQDAVLPPPLKDTARCRACSLRDLCRPKRFRAPPAVADWLTGEIAREPSTDGEPIT